MRNLIRKILKESENELHWAEDMDMTIKYGDAKDILEVGDEILMSGDICDSDGDVLLTLDKEPFIILKKFSDREKNLDMGWKNDEGDRPIGWHRISYAASALKDGLHLNPATYNWDKNLTIEITHREIYPF